jgi:hypothetical protein
MESARPQFPFPRRGIAKDIGLCGTAVMSIWWAGLTPGMDKKTSPTRVGPGNVVPPMHSKRWWISRVVEGKTVYEKKEKK